MLEGRTGQPVALRVISQRSSRLSPEFLELSLGYD
jgi:hypothetical protein